MSNYLYNLAAKGEISWLSYYFARFVCDQSAEDIEGLVAYSAALVSEANQRGHVCVLLDGALQTLFESKMTALAPELPPGEWCAALRLNSCVGLPGEPTPMILDAGRLYLNRYWFFEEQVAQLIRRRLDLEVEIDEPRLAAQLKSLFGEKNENLDEDQKTAVALSACKSLSVISGGPGTGKTTTVIKILSVLLGQQPDMRIALAAPTGKAATRMTESIRLRLDQIDIDSELRSAIPADSQTLHRLLEYRFRQFRYNRSRRLPFDCVVVDEASMIDLTLMYRLLDALPDQARVILLGDRDQLASVSAGNVMGDITGHGHPVAFSESMHSRLARLCGRDAKGDSVQPGPTIISDSIALLEKNYRFGSGSEIGGLSKQINRGKPDRVIAMLKSPDPSTVWIHAETESLQPGALDNIVPGYRAVLEAASVESALDAYEQQRVLSALNKGPFGVEEINRIIENRLGIEPRLGENGNYHGRPVLINRNDYDQGLFNGDTGIVWRGQDNRMSAWFRGSDRTPRQVPLHRLPEHNTAWAMTVHKSQGSEFDRVMIILPQDEQSPVLSRELLYTGITRARTSLTLLASESVLLGAVARVTRRSSGLAARIGWPTS